MIATIIVTLSLVLAAGYTFVWLTKPALRRQIEQPKHRFQAQVYEYNQKCHDSHDEVAGDSDESR